MSHVERAQLFAWLAREGFGPVTLPRLKALLARRDEQARRDRSA
jgi:hypothetical protein